MVDKQFASVNNVPPEPWTGQDTRDRGMRCLIAPHFLALSTLASSNGSQASTDKRKPSVINSQRAFFASR